MNFRKMLLGFFSSSWIVGNSRNSSEIAEHFTVFLILVCSFSSIFLPSIVFHITSENNLWNYPHIWWWVSFNKITLNFLFCFFCFALSPLHPILMILNLYLTSVINWMSVRRLKFNTNHKFSFISIVEESRMFWVILHLAKRNLVSTTRVVCGQCLYSRIFRLYFWLDYVYSGFWRW